MGQECQEGLKVNRIGFRKNIYTYMKKSELTQLTQIIEHIVAKEVRKQLPNIIAETFQNMMGNRKVVNEIKPSIEPIQEEIQDETVNLKSSLRELFAGTPVMSQPQDQRQRQPKQFTKNPVLNQILNETVPDLRSREGMVGMAAFQGGYSPSLNMVPGFNPAAAMMPTEDTIEPSFSKNIPSIPISRPPVLAEGQISNHTPMAAIPEGVSVLDVARQIPLEGSVAKALTRNYSQMLKIIDKKKGKV